jgi:hypothetical protein
LFGDVVDGVIAFSPLAAKWKDSIIIMKGLTFGVE